MFSMTGYGKGEAEYNCNKLSIELKAVNHRFLSLSFKSPRGFASVEDNLRNHIKSRILRGHIEIYINLIIDPKQHDVNVNLDQCDKYMAIADCLSRRYGIVNDFTINNLMSKQDIYNAVSEEDDSDSSLMSAAISALDSAIVMLVAARASEGEKIASDLHGKIDNIELITSKIKTIALQQTDIYRDKLRQRVMEALGDITIDEQRLMNEIVFYADKVATDEEFTRLLAHVNRFREIASGRVEVGKTLDAIAQEMLREANTIGSKCCDAQLGSLVISLKGDIEKVREQVQNIE